MQRWEYLQVTGTLLYGQKAVNPDADQYVWIYSQGGYQVQAELRYSEQHEDRRGKKVEVRSGAEPNLAAMLNKLGAAGWELVGPVPIASDLRAVTLLLKRPKE